MSDHHYAWLVTYPAGERRFGTLAAALRYLAHHEARLGPPTLVGLVPRKEKP
jgi:hypothetical protein